MVAVPLSVDVNLPIKQDLNEVFGFTEFRPGQEAVVSALMAGRSALAVFPTGGGKSLCYQLPALHLEGLTLVVSPLIALMKDQIDFLKSKGVKAERLDSTLSSEQVQEINRAISANELKLLYVAPERFNNERFLAMLGRTKISLFAIDEAHCISEWGHNFRPDYLKLAQATKDLKVERVLALTATATPSVVEDIRTAFAIASEDAIVTGFYRPNLTLLTTPVTALNRDTLLLDRLQSRAPGPSIVYVTFQKTAEAVATELKKQGLPAKAYHAGMDPDVRARVQDWWMAADDGIVVATIAFGMGIDKSNVRYVYHYNLPKGLESYSQEIGRAGRDGLPSTVELLAGMDDVPGLDNFAYGDTPRREDLAGLVEELLSAGPTLSLSLYDLGARHDIRPLVLKTVMTYLELLGVLRQGTPSYAGYEFRPLVEMSDVFGAISGEPGQLVRDLFSVAKRGRTWHSLNPDEAANRLGQGRNRVVRALEVLENRGLIELRASDVRSSYSVLPHGLEVSAILDDLMERFEKREAQEIWRLRQVLNLVEFDGCQVNSLAAHFGEIRPTPCGHCSHCQSKSAQSLIDGDVGEITLLKSDALALYGQIAPHSQSPRFLARVLCGLSSPAMTKQKLSRNPLFGSLDRQSFDRVLAWCEEVVEGR